PGPRGPPGGSRGNLKSRPASRLAVATRGGTHWRSWVDRWDRQQQSYLRVREDRFRAIIEVVRGAVPARPRVVDLGCGPGSLSVRLLRSIPKAVVYPVDLDPVLLTVGRRAFGDARGRLRWT